MLSRNWFPGRLREVQRLAPRRLGKDKHFIWSTSFAVCCMTSLASLPSGCLKVIYLLARPSEDGLRTVNDLRDLVVDRPHIVPDTMRGLQNLRSSHPSLFMRQLV